MKEIKIIKTETVHLFKDVNGNIIKENAVEKDFNDIFIDGVKEKPTKDGLQWLSSSGGVLVFDTEDGEIHDGEYCILPSGKYYIKIENTVYTLTKEQLDKLKLVK